MESVTNCIIFKKRMKYLCFALMVFSFANCSFAQLAKTGDKFVFKGKIIGQDTGKLHLGYVGIDGKYHLDSCSLVNGSFEFHGELNEPRLASFSGNRKSRRVDDPNFTDVFLEPGMITGTFVADSFKQGKVSGSRSHKELEIFNNRYDSLREKWGSTFKRMQEAQEQKDERTVENIYNDELVKFNVENRKVVYTFIEDFPRSFVSAYLLIGQTHVLSSDSLKQFYHHLDPSVKKSTYGTEIASFISKAEKLRIGNMLPNFIQSDMNGNKISLSDYRGKFVLVDFWASWCIPCREEHPYQKAAYSKYRNKGFEIISLSLDQEKEKEAWLTAIKKDGLPWIQVCDFKGWGSDVVQAYNLYGKGIPANFLIDAEGRILAKDLRGQELEELLSKYFQSLTEKQ